MSRLADTLNAELINAEARRAERSPRPDAMDLYFQGRACINKGVTRTFMAQARDFFMRPLRLIRAMSKRRSLRPRSTYPWDQPS